MCGIVGIRAPHGAQPLVLERMADAIRHRGPDSEGFHRRGSVGLAVRRLRIIDLSTGDQPIVSPCSGATIVYNGELYNYRELREELESGGHRFHTSSDTEVALHFYEEYGPEGLFRLNGIFAFAIDDPRTDTLVLVRDQLGVKPLYLAEPIPGTILFASEPKALFASGLVSRELHRPAIGTYLTYGHAVGQRTIWSNIRKLPAGKALVINGDGSRSVSFWDLADRARRWAPGAAEPREELEALLQDAVRRNMISDVPVGAFLSGGVDSSLVTALMGRDTRQLRTYSVGFGHGPDELPDALRVARVLGTEHTALMVTPTDARDALTELVRIYDEPFADAAALPTYLLAKRARQDVTVVLTGEGGDELFGGYRRYVAEQAYKGYRLIPGRLRSVVAEAVADRFPRLRRADRVLRALAIDDRAARFSVWTETFGPSQRAKLIWEDVDDPYAAYRSAVATMKTTHDDVVALMGVELQTWLVDAYLEKVDKATMAASLEARVPLLDPRLVEMMALAPLRWKIKGGSTKVLLKKIASRYLPPETITKPKKGFDPPVAIWLRSTLRERMFAICEPSAAIAEYLDIDSVRNSVVALDNTGRGAPQVWSLLILDEWARQQRVAITASRRV
jgi:asparagine synthase (glutamine-hydrolysing)